MPSIRMPLVKLKHGTKLADQLLLMGVGWLAQEGQLAFVQGKRGRQISLQDGAR